MAEIMFAFLLYFAIDILLGHAKYIKAHYRNSRIILNVKDKMMKKQGKELAIQQAASLAGRALAALEAEAAKIHAAETEKRALIPKSGGGERPLGIPTIARSDGG